MHKQLEECEVMALELAERKQHLEVGSSNKLRFVASLGLIGNRTEDEISNLLMRKRDRGQTERDRDSSARTNN
jgi:hypothetical protein